MYFDEMYFDEIVEVIEETENNLVVVYCEFDRDTEEFLRKMDEYGYERKDRLGPEDDLLYLNPRKADRYRHTGYVVCKQTKTIFIADWRILADEYGIYPIEYKRKDFYKQVDFTEAMEHFSKGGTVRHGRFGDARYFNGRNSDSLINSCGAAIKIDEVLDDEWFIRIEDKEVKVSDRKRVELLEKIIKEKGEELKCLFDFMSFHNVHDNINITDIGFTYEDEVIFHPFRYGADAISRYGDSFIYSKIADMLLEYYAEG